MHGGTQGWYINLGFLTLVKSAVPLFFMISGALLLGREADCIWANKHIIRTIKTIVFWNLLFMCFVYIVRHSFYDMLQVLVYGYGPFWYLYTLLSVYIILPCLQCISSKPQLLKRCLILFLLYILVVTLKVCLPAELSKIILHLTTETGLESFPAFCGYLLWGYYLGNNSMPVFLRNGYLRAAVFLSVNLFFYIYSFYLSLDGEFDMSVIEIYTLCSFVNASILFTWIKEHEAGIQAKYIFHKSLNFLAKYSFGIFLIHMPIIEILNYCGITLNYYNKMGIGVLVISFIVVALSVIITYFLKKLPCFCKMVEW